MRNPGIRRLLWVSMSATILVAGCKGGAEQRQIIADANIYLKLADAGDAKAYQRLSSSAKKHITESDFIERMRAVGGDQTERRRMEVVGTWEDKALVQYEVKYGTGPWEREEGFYTREPGGWMRAFSRQLSYQDARKSGPEAEKAVLQKLLEIEPDPTYFLGLCSLDYNRGDKSGGERACRMAVQSADHFPTKEYRGIRLLANELLMLHADDWAARVREASEALAFMDKNPDLGREREGSFRIARLGTHINRFQAGQGALSQVEWRLVEEDWSKLRALCEQGPCSGLGKQVQSMTAGMDGLLAQRRAASPSSMATDRRGLGGGYKGIKWGSSQKQVIEALGMKPKESTADTLTFKYGGGGEGSEKELTCLFYQGRFFGALFEPGLSDGDQQGANAIQQALVEKYGKPEEVTGLVDGMLGIPLVAFEWNDGETMIRSTVMDPEKLDANLQSAGRGNRFGYPSSTLKVAYSSIALAAQKKRNEGESKARAEKEERQRKKAKFAGDL
jgi:hypothetical protein